MSDERIDPMERLIRLLKDALDAAVVERDRLRDIVEDPDSVHGELRDLGEALGDDRVTDATVAQRVQAVVDERDRLRESDNEYADLTDRLSRLLTGVANALKGEPPPLVMHDWSDLPRVAANAVDERDRLRVAMEKIVADWEQIDGDADVVEVFTLLSEMHRIMDTARNALDLGGSPASEGLEVELAREKALLVAVVAERDRFASAAETLVAVIESAHPGTDVWRLSGSEPVYQLKAALGASGEVTGG